MNKNQQPIIQVIRATKTYNLDKAVVQALAEVDLQIDPGEFLCLAGPSGSGKSTLLNLISALDHPTQGQVLLLGEDLAKMNDRQITQVRLRRIGFIFQSFNLLPVLTVYENVQYPLILLGTAQQHDRIMSALEAVGLAERANHRPDELSGGQRQRVAIARALVTDPQMVLADEPTANLDSKTGTAILDLMVRLNTERQVTFVFASHDPKIIERAKRVIHMQDGRII